MKEVDRIHCVKQKRGPDEVPRLMLLPSIFLFGGVGNGSGKGESHGQVQ